jgi:hypothetical protein
MAAKKGGGSTRRTIRSVKKTARKIGEKTRTTYDKGISKVKDIVESFGENDTPLDGSEDQDKRGDLD